jgi:nondiscriminating glutamyl-tRNA synthetase
MGITHVIRGEDHLPNTPRQILLYESLGFSAPRFAHLPMILGPDSSKLSKRHGDVTLDAFRKKGMLPDALVNGLALLGWSDESGEEILTRDELVERFRLERVIKTGAVFDEAKLRHINREHMKKLSDSELADLVLPYLQEAGRIPEGPLPEEAGAWLGHVASFLRERIEVLSDTEGETDILWNFDASGMDEKAREVLADADAPRVVRALIERLEASDDLGKPGAYREIVLSIRDEEKVKGKALFHPLRVALTAATEGPDMETLFPLLAVGSRLDLPKRIVGPCERAGQALEALHQG